MLFWYEYHIKSRFNDFKFYFKKKKDNSHIPLGAAFIYQCKPSKKEIYTIHKIWAKPFPIQTGTLCWEDTQELLSVGNDDGKIYDSLKRKQTIAINGHVECNYGQRIIANAISFIKEPERV